MTHGDSSRELGEVGTWVEQYGDVLYRYALGRVKDRHVAEDLVQETFLAALEKFDQFEGRSKTTTWLIGILRNKVGSYWRKSGRERPESEIADDPDFGLAFFDKRGHWKGGIAVVSAHPEDEIERKELLAIFSQCLSQLPETLSETFSLRELDGLDTAQICGCLGISESNLSVRLHRARMLLRRCLEVNWLTSQTRNR